MINIERKIEKSIKHWLFKGKILVIYGPRQVGKTTLAKKILSENNASSSFFNCENPNVKSIIESMDPVKIRSMIGNTKIVVFDEAQQVFNIGKALKIFIDEYKDIQIIATGSSSFDLANKLNEPLTGRSLEFNLYPFSISEIDQVYDGIKKDGILDKILIYGLYPEVFLAGEEDSKILIENISNKYLYKDLFDFQDIRNPKLLKDLLQLIALQVSREVSTNELATKLGVSRTVIERYLDLLEKTFVIFRLYAFSRNIRNEIGGKYKVYFYDLGIRNSIIDRFQGLNFRDDFDIGALWENFVIIEMIKKGKYDGRFFKSYFWKTYDKKEIDYIEESDGQILGIECKYSKSNNNSNTVKIFTETYKNSKLEIINKYNYKNFF